MSRLKCHLCASLGALAAVIPLSGQKFNAEAMRVAKAIEEKYSAAQEYTFEATLQLARKRAEEVPDVVSEVKLKVAVGSEGKYLLWADGANNAEFLIVSDGRTTWEYVPAQKRYAKFEGGGAGIAANPDEAFMAGVRDGDNDVILPSALIVPILARLTRNVALIDMMKVANVELDGDERELPVLSVLSPKNEQAGQSLTEVVVDPKTLDIARVEWTKSTSSGDDQRFTVLRADFKRLSIGQPIPPSYFVFSPPGDAGMVEDLAIPGLGESTLLNIAAIDFPLPGIGTPKARLSDLRNHVVILAFFAGGSTVWREQVAALAAVREECKDKGVIVVGIATQTPPDAERSTAVPIILDEAGGKLHRAYRVQFAPTIVVIDGLGKVVRFLPGARGLEALKAALKGTGL